MGPTESEWRGRKKGRNPLNQGKTYLKLLYSNPCSKRWSVRSIDIWILCRLWRMHESESLCIRSECWHGWTRNRLFDALFFLLSVSISETFSYLLLMVFRDDRTRIHIEKNITIFDERIKCVENPLKSRTKCDAKTPTKQLPKQAIWLKFLKSSMFLTGLKLFWIAFLENDRMITKIKKKKIRNRWCWWAIKWRWSSQLRGPARSLWSPRHLLLDRWAPSFLKHGHPSESNRKKASLRVFGLSSSSIRTRVSLIGSSFGHWMK